MPHVGDVLVGRYRIDAPLGAGGSAMVYRAHDLRLGRDVALKILLPNLASDTAVAHRFEREARSLAAVNHPGIVAVYDVEAADTRTGREPFFVMELCDRGSLAELLAARGGRLSPDAVVPSVADIAGGLTSLHARGFVHRDVKPHNILLTPGGAKLGDFGIARTGDATSSFTAPGTAVGTLAYLAPELLSGGEATPASDVFALGVVAYQALTGRLPRPAGTVMEFVNAQGSPIAPPSEIQPDLGTFFDAPIAAALASDPAARPAPISLGGGLKAAVADWKRSTRRVEAPAAGPEAAAPEAVLDSGASVRDARRPIRLAPSDPGLPAAGRTATIRIRTGRRAPAPEWLPPERRGWTGPLIAAVLLLALAGVVAIALTGGFGLFGGSAGGPTPAPSGSPAASATVPASPSPSPSPSPIPSPSPSPSPLPSPTPVATLAPTPPPTAPSASGPAASATPFRVVDKNTARSAIRNIGTAIDNLEGTGGITASAAEDLRLRLAGIADAVQDRDYDDAALRARMFQERIEALVAGGELASSAELRQEVDKLRGALPLA